MGVVLNYFHLLDSVAAETIVVVTALLVLVIDMVVMQSESVRNRFLVCGSFAIFGLLGSISWLTFISYPALSQNVADCPLMVMSYADPLSQLVKMGLLVMVIFTLGLSMDSEFTRHVGEYISLILFSTVGMMLLISATDLLLFFVSLELTSLSLYILCGFNGLKKASTEAALKYLLLGGISAAFTLFGLSYLYGATGETNIFRIAAKFTGVFPVKDPLLMVSLVMIAIGFGFKIAAAPFHLWAPDVYQGAPNPSAAFIASSSKLAGFFVFGRIILVAFKGSAGLGSWHQFETGWLPLIALISAASMVIGNVGALAQKDVKRLLAYSAIAQGGYTLLGLLANTQQGVCSVIFYMFTYGLTVIGTFAVVGIVERKRGATRLADFAGFAKNEPAIAFCMMVFMLSLAGIPPLAGFFGKFYLFSSVVAGAKNLGLLWLVILGIATSAVSLYYYLQVLKQVYVKPSQDSAPWGTVSIQTRVVIYCLAASVVILGVLPDLVLDPLLAAVHSFTFN
jgi:NADH-quinone oxidoreductase subunit N